MNLPRARLSLSWHPHRERLKAVGRRSQQVLLIAGATGAIVGLVVAGFERITGEVLLSTLLDQPLWVQALAPGVGLLIAAACLRAAGPRVTPATSDEYIRVFHDTSGRLSLRLVPFRLAAAVVTLGFGGPLGYEGPALYAGAGIGSAIQRRLRRYFTAEDAKVLLVAGAAAGVAAIFKAPVTGLVFALEVPYQEDLARRMLLPAATSAAASYVTFAALAGTDAILPVAGQPPFNLVDLGGAAVVGLAAGILARVFIALVQAAKRASTRGHPASRAVVAGAVLAVTVVLADVVGDASLGLGPGYHALEWALDPTHSLVAIIALGTLRVVATSAVVGGGGTGGLFIPLVIQGALVGRAVGGAFEIETTTLFPVVGMAAFLGAGYRVPLAAVVFVAEFTGRPGFVVPGLIAAVVAQLVMGSSSISPYQVAGRIGHLEHRLQLPLSSVVNTEARTAPPDATIEEVFWQHLVGTRQQSVAIVDGGTYLGIVRAEDVGEVAPEAWATTQARSIMRTDVPVADMAWVLGDAIRALDDAASDRIAVCADGTFIGVITAADLIELDEVLHRTSPRPPAER
ncbi:MAG TPA: chloride channel protein [Acidimicrobiales bacterium]|nr:chloride channel protein [Acidimicrobiales bacterium]